MNKKNLYWLIVTITICLLLFSVWITVFSGNYQHSNNHDMGDAQSNPLPQANEQKLKDYLNEEKNIMTNMMKEMHNIVHSQNASIDFLAGMIPHHEAAIAMVNSYEKFGAKDPKLKRIASEIKAAQTEEIQQMKIMIQSIKSSGAKDEAKEKAYLEKYDAMMAQHHALNNSASTIDEVFVNGMIVHHQMAVEMAKAILDYTDEKSIKNLANTIIQTQEREIDEMNRILNRLKITGKTN